MSVGTDITNRNMCLHCKGDLFRSLEVYPIFEEQGPNDMPFQQDGTPLDFHVTVRVRSRLSKFPWKYIRRYGHFVPMTLNHLISSSEVTYTFYKTLQQLHPPSLKTCEMNLNTDYMPALTEQLQVSHVRQMYCTSHKLDRRTYKNRLVFASVTFKIAYMPCAHSVCISYTSPLSTAYQTSSSFNNKIYGNLECKHCTPHINFGNNGTYPH